MRSLVVLIALTNTAFAEDRQPRVTIGTSRSIAIDGYLTLLYNAQAAYKLSDKYWLDATFGFGEAGLLDPAGSGQGDSSAYEARVGYGRIRYTSNFCVGVIAGAGWSHHRIEFADGLVNPPMRTEVRDQLFGELRGIASVRIGGYVSLEAALALRSASALRLEEGAEASRLGVLGSVGIHVTL